MKIKLLLILITIVTVSCRRDTANSTTSNNYKYDKVVDYFNNKGDSLQILASQFILENINIHESHDYYFADSLGKRIQFDELKYPDFDSSLIAFEKIKSNNKTIKAVKYNYYDEDTISSDFIIKNIEQSFKVWKYPWNKNVTFDQFCEFILPYRVNTEPVQNWRNKYLDINTKVIDSIGENSLNKLYTSLYDSIRKKFINTNAFSESRQEPIPLLGPLNLLHRKQGDCADYVNFNAYNYRSIGIPICVDFVPYWGTAKGRHFWNVFFTPRGDEIIIDKKKSFELKNYFPREMPKVYRITYSEQKNSIASKLNNVLVPDNLLSLKNIKDVTGHYVETTDIKLEIPILSNNEAVYLCVMNGLKWRPVAGSLMNNKYIVNFSKMGRGIVYLPQAFIDGKFYPVHNPFSIDKNGNIKEYKTNEEELTDIVMKEEEGYLHYRNDKKYSLRYWNNGWNRLEAKVYKGGFKLIFLQVPVNSVYLMVPEYTWGNERPFTLAKNGNRIWW